MLPANLRSRPWACPIVSDLLDRVAHVSRKARRGTQDKDRVFLFLAELGAIPAWLALNVRVTSDGNAGNRISVDADQEFFVRQAFDGTGRVQMYVTLQPVLTGAREPVGNIPLSCQRIPRWRRCSFAAAGLTRP